MTLLSAAWTVFTKELRDALRDRRTLVAVALSSVLLGPLMLVLLSTLVSTLEERAQSREVVVDGIDHGATLANFLQRQGLVLKPAPADYEQALVARTLGDAVLVIPPEFEAELAAGLRPTLLLVSVQAGKRERARDPTHFDGVSGAVARWPAATEGSIVPDLPPPLAGALLRPLAEYEALAGGAF